MANRSTKTKFRSPASSRTISGPAEPLLDSLLFMIRTNLPFAASRIIRLALAFQSGCTVSTLQAGKLADFATFRSLLTDRPLYGLKRFSTTIAKHLNDLPITSPHGSDFDATRKLLKLHQFERSTRHSDGTPQQMLRHPQRLSGHCEAKNGNADLPKAMKDHPLLPKSGSSFSVGSCGGKHRLQGQIPRC